MTDTVPPTTPPATTAPGSPPPAERPPITVKTVRSAFGLLREPFWAKLTLAVIALSVAFYYLGRWQLGRHEGVVAENNRIHANYWAVPVPVADVLPTPDTVLPKKKEWTQVRVTGVYELQHQIVVRNRPLNDNFGFEVIVPLRMASGAALLVDRGWVAPGPNTVDPGAIPAPPTGQVTVVVRLRPGEPPLKRSPPPGQELRIDLGRLAAVAGGTVYRGAYGLMASESPAPAQAPAGFPEPVEDLGMHLAYAIQWWIGDVAAYVLLIRFALREVTDRELGGAARPSAGSGGTGPGTSGPGRPPARSALWTSKRQGPTDEEIEDAALD